MPYSDSTNSDDWVVNLTRWIHYPERRDIVPPDGIRIVDWEGLPPLPAGWFWDIEPGHGGVVRNPGVTRHTPAEQLVELYQALIDWAEAHELIVTIYDEMPLRVPPAPSPFPDGFSRTYSVPRMFRVYMREDVLRLGIREYELPPLRPCLVDEEHAHTRWTPRCPDCHTPYECPYCGAQEVARHDDNAGWACPSCAQECAHDDCELLTRRTWCDDHGVWEECTRCGRDEYRHVDEASTYVDVTGMTVCLYCAELYCAGCGEFTASPEDEGPCSNCIRQELQGDNAEEFDERSDMPATRLRLDTLPGRDAIRMCGVEIEGAGNYRPVASDLYAAGLAATPEMHAYHRGSDGGFAHFERDSSVDWELVVGPLNPADTQDVRKLNKIVRAVRKHIKQGNVSLDLRCGLHIHVGAERVALYQAYNLHHLYTYIEDPFFRLAAARWPIHRAIVNTTHYCQLVPKYHRKVPWAQQMQSNRYYSLSFSNYLTRMLQNCQCGAVQYDAWDECSCQLRKCTFEFRLFNSTANTRKLHAYLALTQALVAKALSLPEIRDGDAYPALPFNVTRIKDMQEDNQADLMERWVERLRWMVTELPLTEYEKQSLRYCVEHSELNLLGDAIIDELFSEERQNEEVLV